MEHPKKEEAPFDGLDVLLAHALESKSGEKVRRTREDLRLNMWKHLHGHFAERVGPVIREVIKTQKAGAESVPGLRPHTEADAMARIRAYMQEEQEIRRHTHNSRGKLKMLLQFLGS